MDSTSLRELATELARRPGHEKVRAEIYNVLVHALKAKRADIDFERPVPEVRGRIDALLGRTIFEFKSHLQKERTDALAQLSRYLPQRESATGHQYVGIATDGLDYEVYALRDGQPARIAQHALRPEQAGEWLAWLDSVIAVQDQLEATPLNIQRDLGRNSIAYHQAAEDFRRLWRELRDDAEARLKFDLWRQLLQGAYWFEMGDEELFVQHTYLTIVAKTIATLTLHETLPTEAKDVLSGEVFRSRGIHGGVEHDFFSWVLKHPDGSDVVWRLVRQVDRFRLRDVKTDILKSLYESLIDPAQRHDLGEYYTPDWLAERICNEAIDDPLNQRVLDPSCGSGTFLFHAMRRVLVEAKKAGLTNDQALEAACEQVVGIDIHPVAAVFAGTTCILALQELLRKRNAKVTIPVYLGDSLQWNVHEFHDKQHVVVRVPDGPEMLFPEEIARNPSTFDSIVDAMQDHSRRHESIDAFSGWISRQREIASEHRKDLCDTYGTLLKLVQEGRNEIWTFVVKHTSRPLWLSRPDQQVDRIVGNPPWLAFRYMARGKQRRFREECQKLGVWVGGNVATQQDLSAYFFARAAALYLRDGGTASMVMPFASMTREAYSTFRTGRFSRPGTEGLRLQFINAWTFESNVQPLFQVPSCVLFAQKGETTGHPAEALAFVGDLIRRDASLVEADKALTKSRIPWPGSGPILDSPYREAFRNGATLFPRRFLFVTKLPEGKLGMDWKAPLVRGRVGSQDKKPWNRIEPWEGQVEAKFLRPVYLGESIAPFRTLEPLLAVIPWHEKLDLVMSGQEASSLGFPGLSNWMKRAESFWKQHRRGDMSFRDQIDYFGKLSAQFPIAPVRVVYAKAGTLPAAAILRDQAGVLDHKLYWANTESIEEAFYLVSVFNSDALRRRIEVFQSQGQWGPRDFDKHIFNAPIPKFNAKDKHHQGLIETAQRAESIANAVPIAENCHFIRARKLVRHALVASGITKTLDTLVDELLRPLEPAIMVRKQRRAQEQEQRPPARRTPSA